MSLFFLLFCVCDFVALCEQHLKHWTQVKHTNGESEPQTHPANEFSMSTA